jgi:hypothetical protein
MRSALVLALVALVSVYPGAAPAAELPVAPPPQVPVPVDELKKGLVKALGDDFEFLDGEVGRTRTSVGSMAAERFWFAKVRPKKAGQYAISYVTAFDFELTAAQKANWRWPDRATTLIPIAVGEKGAPRLVHPGGYGGSAYPHANVGDTLIIPIHVDRYRTGHSFSVPEPKHPQVKAFFSVVGEPLHDKYLKMSAEKPVVKNDTGERVKLLSSWGSSFANRSGSATSHSLSAYLEFAAPGEFNLAGRLADPAAMPESAGFAFRVVAKDKPVTVVLEHSYYREQTGATNVHMSNSLGAGTLEVRVGDRVLIGAGGYHTGEIDRSKEYRPGVVLTRPFNPIDTYTPDPRK